MDSNISFCGFGKLNMHCDLELTQISMCFFLTNNSSKRESYPLTSAFQFKQIGLLKREHYSLQISPKVQQKIAPYIPLSGRTKKDGKEKPTSLEVAQGQTGTPGGSTASGKRPHSSSRLQTMERSLFLPAFVLLTSPFVLLRKEREKEEGAGGDSRGN